jgi:membrane-bound lytic murein transglycosylase D
MYNYSVLDDWLLALAAYNCGLGKVTRTIEKTGIHDFWTLAEKGYLPYETAHYIPKFLAIAGICSYPGRYGFSIPWDEAFLWERIALDQAVDLRILSRETGIPYDVLVEGNLELRYRVSPPGDHNYFLKVPAVYSDVVRETLEQEDHKLMKFHIYEICSGDTLYDLSLHYGITVEMIKEYNSGINPRALRIGQRVLVPLLKDIAPYQGKKRKETGRVTASGRPFTETYTVQKGDTLWGIARKHGISPEELADRNLLTLDTVIHGGLVLKVPGKKEDIDGEETFIR